MFILFYFIYLFFYFLFFLINFLLLFNYEMKNGKANEVLKSNEGWMWEESDGRGGVRSEEWMDE